MDALKHMRHDHAELRSLAQSITEGDRGPASGSRDERFATYRTQVLQHLAVVEDVLLAPELAESYGANSPPEIRAEHKVIRQELKHLDRSHKERNDWTAEFRSFTDRFDRLCHRHEAMMTHAQTRMDNQSIEQRYQEAQSEHMSPGGGWKRIAGGAAAVAGAAAAAGAAWVASRYLGGAMPQAGSDPTLRMETDENLFLISSRKVEGTPVLDPSGERIGHVESFMVGKYSGRVAYAVLSFGGTLGLGSSYFPIPWSLLDYEEAKGGYVLGVPKDRMMDAPRFETKDEPEFGPDQWRSVAAFYAEPATPSPSPSPSPEGGSPERSASPASEPMRA